ncbi:DNA translocase FtsK [Candidatus Thioglobus sp.]|uniref:DNA translocase FtsK n=1 Tax=Candidatus Thioglobus sp. TaxID=2026721 RepID=UPI001D41915C|nr:DNA translocase FtsK [Candidatus Thioglobus sp.]MBT3277419.1 DNA translocase FtsK [Candidatus Thioglobus sp.]MBT3744385.1 DNA translocase FtsK [Candidatus Thioglobus sp.]MBT4001560.1 DNA translocase FtsK [Candidatus Thioglobus sp.]MBT4181758.1 DNA translocase FtsK [Candidatus Thioglobus sp.]MBT4421648.1 DNA translocase FtsK [Candidatus Thioglobus sp.]
MKKNTSIKAKKNRQSPRTKASSEILFIVLGAIGLIYLSALLTHSPHENPWSGDVALDASVANLAGIFGAYLSDISLSILGFSAYIIPISLAWFGWCVHKNAEQPKPPKLMILIRNFALLILIAFSSAFLAQNFTNTGASGGYLGVSMHDYFGVLFGSASLIVYLGIMMVSFSIVASTSWINIFSSTSSTLGVFFAKIQQQRAKSKLNQQEKIKITPKPTIKPSVVAKVKAAKVKKIKKPTSSNLFNTATVAGLPSLDLLDEPANNTSGFSEQVLEDMSRQVEVKLKDFGFDVTITTVTPGPVVTQFELSLAPGVKVSQIMNLNKDLARALLVESVRIVDVIPGKPVIGLEIPNEVREMISLKEVLASEAFAKSSSTLSMGLGKDINGNPIVANLAKMPHLLVAGATGMGKSVGLNAMILSVLYKAKPDEVRIIMIDPKIVELAIYADIPHLLTPVVTDMNEAASALWWCVNEMERRYSLLAKFGVRNIDGFNEKLKKAKEKGEPLLDPSFNKNTAAEGESAAELEALPLIMLVIDEYADMLGALAQEDRAKAKRVEALIVRLAQKARAAGIHIIIATQRPSVDVITGLIKSNVPTRIAFKVSSKVDSRTILDQGGAEQLLGMGDMLYMSPGMAHLTRVHGAFVDDDEILRVVNFLKESSETNYLDGILNAHSESQGSHEGTGGTTSTAGGEADPLYDEAVQIVTSSRRASISSLQRRMRIGYNRAARIIEDMESAGVVSTMNSAGNRQVLAPEPINTND